MSRSNPHPFRIEHEGSLMRAAVVTSFDQPLIVVRRPIPSPGPGQVLVRMETCGLCHTDIHAARGDWPVQPALPLIPGHEGVGIVERLGAGVVDRILGERVAIPWLAWACGECRYCIDGRETLCEDQQNSGYSVDGAFAEYAVASARYVVAVPDGVSALDAAPLTCAGVTTYKALRVARVAPAEVVAVFGIGGLGHLAVQYARLFGATVIAVDVAESKLRLASTLGADHLVNASITDPVEQLGELGGVDVALVLAASPAVFTQALASLRRGGRLVCVAMPADGATMPVPIFDTVVGGLSVIGSIVGTRQDVADVFQLHLEGRTRVIQQVRPLEDVNIAMAEVLAGKVDARVVFDFAPLRSHTGPLETDADRLAPQA